jgi:phosphoribosylamine--glycine ligase
MRVLLVGSGGREDALAWAISRSPKLKRLRCAPGNAGMSRRGEIVDIDAGDVEGVVTHVRGAGYDLVVVGPEAPLVNGLADRLREIDVPVFGPSAAAARIEGSKVFAKELMARHRIPTAAFDVFDDAERAKEHLRSAAAAYPLVLKADGLAAGKGVLFADGPAEAGAAVDELMVRMRFGRAGSRIVVEQRLEGREASFFVLSDGERFVELATCQDYKRAFDGDVGPNTGGMGTYSPSAYLTDELRGIIVDTIVRPTIAGMAAEGRPYRGVLYVGVMLTSEGPKVLEYNARFGDPETQVLMPRLDGDWLDLLHASATGRLDECSPRWKPGAAVCVVMASGGYPEAYEKGKPIAGLERADSMEGVCVFHAGTTTDPDGRCVTSGGRVLGVTAVGPGLAEARDRAYEAASTIAWEGERHRTDIALDAVLQTVERSEA